jgi:hypothetical protein
MRFALCHLLFVEAGCFRQAFNMTSGKLKALFN